MTAPRIIFTTPEEEQNNNPRHRTRGKCPSRSSSIRRNTDTEDTNRNNKRRELPDGQEIRTTMTAKISTDDQNYVAILTAGWGYDALPKIDAACNCHIQRKLNITRYCIPEPPRGMSNISNVYTAKNYQPDKCPNLTSATPDHIRRYGAGSKLKKHPTENASARPRKQRSLQLLRNPSTKGHWGQQMTNRGKRKMEIYD